MQKIYMTSFTRGWDLNWKIKKAKVAIADLWCHKLRVSREASWLNGLEIQCRNWRGTWVVNTSSENSRSWVFVELSDLFIVNHIFFVCFVARFFCPKKLHVHALSNLEITKGWLNIMFHIKHCASPGCKCRGNGGITSMVKSLRQVPTEAMREREKSKENQRGVRRHVVAMWRNEWQESVHNKVVD